MRKRWRQSEQRLIRAASGLALISASATVLTGCAWLFGFEDGQAEGERLGAAVAEIPGVESVESTGSMQHPAAEAVARVHVRMRADASPADLEGVILEWNAAASEQDEQSIRRVLLVEYLTPDCIAEVRYDTDVRRLRGTAQFLPALCAAVDGGHVRIEDTWYSRSVNVIEPDTPVDVAQLRALPGAVIDLTTTDYDNWTIDGVRYAWHDQAQ